MKAPVYFWQFKQTEFIIIIIYARLNNEIHIKFRNGLQNPLFLPNLLQNHLRIHLQNRLFLQNYSSLLDFDLKKVLF